MRFVFLLESWYIDSILVFIEVRKSGIIQASDGVLCSWFMLEISLKWMRFEFLLEFILIGYMSG